MRTNAEIKAHRNALMGIMLHFAAILGLEKLTAKERQEGESMISQLEGEIELCSWILGDIDYTWLTVDKPNTFDFGAN